ncbi:Ig-like domain-containing protein [Micropruina sp.]|uniref:Ig-like domain-containing protein n=1 Tax=Micropruina sp. TaxID=2737536 RepID=UPI00260C219A|nr:Ig-like domain-containing protein [Micropruina sp.]
MNTHTRHSTRALAVLVSGALALSVAPAAPASANGPQLRPIAAPAAAPSGGSAFARQLESKYIDPDRIYSADIRWWLGEAAHTDETLLEQIQVLYDAGFRGVELCMQNDGSAADADYAYGSEMWTHKWSLMMNKLLDLGMSVYLTSGTNWATSNVPGLDPVSQAAMQNLTLGTATVNAGETLTTLPVPAANARRAGAKLVTAYAYRSVSDSAVDPDSRIDLAAQLTQGADVWTQDLDWTAPEDGAYRIFALWTQGTYQTSSPSAQPSYATNYFDERGVAALKEFWEAHYLSDPALREKIRQGDVQLFMDSLEVTYGTGGFTWWAEDMAAEFHRRKGYDVTPYLFLISGVSASVANPYHRVADTGTYRLDGDEKRRQAIINDYQDVLTELYMERMLTPLKTWLNSVGIATRAQISYGKPIEISEPAMAVDYPEAENLNQYNQVDIFRLWTGGAKLENKVLSSETSAVPIGWNMTYQKRLQDAYSTYAAGFQRIVWHVWASDFGYGNYQWPGFDPSPFNLKFPLLGTRNPAAANYDEFNAHLGRIQQLMQTGKSRTDVGFIHQNWTQGIRFGGGVGNNNAQMNWQQAHQGIYYRSTDLQDNGYTYDYFSPDFLFDDDVSFNEATKTIEQAGYKAIVLYQDWLDVKAAQKLLGWAKKGLKVVVLEDAGSRTPFNDGKDGLLKKIMTELKSLATVRTATVYDDIDYFSAAPGGYDDNVMEKLQELGVHPYAGYSEPNLQLLTQTRQDDAGNRYLYAYNYGDDDYHQYSHKAGVRTTQFGTNITTEIELDGRFIPYSIDAWSGEVTELGKYRWSDGRTVVPIDLDYNNVALMAFEKVSEDALHVVSTNGDSAYAIGDGVAVRTMTSGSLETKLSDGREYRSEVAVPAAFDITGWDVTVESWRPNATAGDLSRTETIDGLTTVNRKTSTVTTPISVQLDSLTTWNNIPEVGKTVSGTGHYRAEFTWDASAASGAYLDLGATLEESMVVWVNGKKVGGDVSTNPTKVKRDVGGVGKPTIDDGTGKQVPLVGGDIHSGGISWTKPIANVTKYLVDGENEIEIEYNSSLANVQLDRGVVNVQPNGSNWWKYDVDYLEFGPRQAKVVPFVDVHYTSALSQLSDAISAAEALLADVESEVFTESTASAFVAALTEAKAVLAEPTAGEETVNAAAEALEAATQALVERGDPAVLEAMVEAADALLAKSGSYTEASVTALQDAVDAAKAVWVDRADQAQAGLDAAVSALQGAISGLEVKSPKPSKAVLEQVYLTISGLVNNDGKYTAGSWEELQEQLAAAKQVLDDGAATQAQIDAAVERLNQAVASLEVAGPVVERVKLNQSQLRLVKGKRLTLEEGVYYSNAHPAYVGQVTWQSSNTKVATVSSDGTVKAKKPGTTTITVTTTQMTGAGKKATSKIKVTVVKNKPRSTVTKVSASVPKTMRAGQVIYITGTYSSAKATGIKVTYKSSKPSVATVDPVGRIVAKAKGAAKITVKAGKKSKTYTVKVT